MEKNQKLNKVHEFGFFFKFRKVHAFEKNL